MIKKILPLLSLLVLATGCSDILKNDGSVFVEYGPDFDVNSVNLECAYTTDNKDCDGSVGMLLRTIKSFTGYKASRCTAWKTNSDKDNVIVANMHCLGGADQASNIQLSNMYYILPDKASPSKKVYKVKRLIKGRKNPGMKIGSSRTKEFNLDYAYFELEESLATIPSIEIDPSSLADDLNPRVVSVNKRTYSLSNYTFKLDTYKNCKVTSDNIFYPYEISPNRTFVALKDCPVVGGNSGSAVIDGNKAVALIWGKPGTTSSSSSLSQLYKDQFKKLGFDDLIENSQYTTFSKGNVAFASSFSCIPDHTDTSDSYLKEGCVNWHESLDYPSQLRKSLNRQRVELEAKMSATEHNNYYDIDVNPYAFLWELEEASASDFFDDAEIIYTFAPKCKEEARKKTYKLAQTVEFYINSELELTYRTEVYAKKGPFLCSRR